MDAERDHLQTHVFPALAERLRAHRTDLVPVDLRWGVETVSLADEEAKELAVVKVCLTEIERSRPYFIALVGDRYGWVPSADRLRRAALEAGVDRDVEGMSVTALEIEHGALDDPAGEARAFFYLRRPLPYDDMPADVAAAFSDAHATDEGARRRVDRLDALKQRLQSELPDRVRWYEADWDPERRRVQGLAVFGDRVLEDLWSAFVADLDADLQERESSSRGGPADVGQQGSFEDEREALDAFLHDRTRDFVGREELLHDLVRRATGVSTEAARVTALVGVAGTGKSAVSARVVEELRSNPEVVVLANSAGASAQAKETADVIRRWIDELAAVAGRLPRDRPDSGARERVWLIRGLAEMVTEVARRRHVVAVVDALDEMVDVEYFTWLYEGWPADARVIVTCQHPGDAAELHAAGLDVVELGPLTQDEARALVGQVCGRYRRTLHEDVVAALLHREEGDSGIAPLWLHLALEDLLLLDADDYERLGSMTGSPEERLHWLLLDTAAAYPPALPSLYGSVFDRVATTYGEPLVTGMTDLLAVSPDGLRESDLLPILAALTGSQPTAVTLASIRRGLRAHLTPRGPSRWTLTHEQARRVIRQRIDAEPGRLERLHSVIADHLLALPDDDPLRSQHAMHHLIGANDVHRASAFLGAALSSTALLAATRSVARVLSESRDRSPNPGIAQIELLLQQARDVGEEAVCRVGQALSSQMFPLDLRSIALDDQRTIAWLVADALTGVPGVEAAVEIPAQSWLGVLAAQSGSSAQATAAFEAAERRARGWADGGDVGDLAMAGFAHACVILLRATMTEPSEVALELWTEAVRRLTDLDTCGFHPVLVPEVLVVAQCGRAAVEEAMGASDAASESLLAASAVAERCLRESSGGALRIAAMVHAESARLALVHRQRRPARQHCERATQLANELRRHAPYSRTVMSLVQALVLHALLEVDEGRVADAGHSIRRARAVLRGQEILDDRHPSRLALLEEADRQLGALEEGADADGDFFTRRFAGDLGAASGTVWGRLRLMEWSWTVLEDLSMVAVTDRGADAAPMVEVDARLAAIEAGLRRRDPLALERVTRAWGAVYQERASSGDERGSLAALLLAVEAADRWTSVDRRSATAAGLRAAVRVELADRTQGEPDPAVRQRTLAGAAEAAVHWASLAPADDQALGAVFSTAVAGYGAAGADPAAAEGWLVPAFDVLRSGFEAEPDAADRAEHVRLVAGVLASDRQATGDTAGAIAALEAAVAASEHLRSAGRLGVADLTLLAGTWSELAELFVASNDLGPAVDAREATIAVLGEVLDADPGNEQARSSMLSTCIAGGIEAEEYARRTGGSLDRAAALAAAAKAHADARLADAPDDHMARPAAEFADQFLADIAQRRGEVHGDAHGDGSTWSTESPRD